MKKIVVVGGGTAGWLVAIFAKKVFSEDVTVIASSKIDILGAGEGTTPNFTSLLKNFKIDIDDFIKKTDATIKCGIKFHNWNKDKTGVFDHLFNLGTEMRYGMHFNARKTADYLEGLAKTLGIKKEDKLIKKFISNTNGDIVKIQTEEGIDIECDFIFDCSGFQRIVIGGHHKSEWLSYSDKLMCNKALGFFLPQTEKLNSKSITKTNAFAMNYGWMWQVPLQNRFGCGYVFNNDFITVDQAKKEVEDYLGHPIDIVKVFDFNPGSYKKTWINNTIALGLASGFVEPLEATSIMGLVASMEKLMKYNIFEKNENDIIDYNEFVESNNSQIVYFLMHHYNCGRSDTPFWQRINEITFPDIIKRIRDEETFDLDKFKVYFNTKNNDLVFTEKNYEAVIGGHKLKKIEKSII